jgi:GNAT superfamily N-acetyltransferase
MIAEAKSEPAGGEARIRIESVSGSNYHDIPSADFGFDCKSCMYWEMEWGHSVSEVREPEAAKRQWFTTSSGFYGPCGKLVYDGDKVVAWAQYAPASCFPRAGGYHTHPSNDAYLITCLAVAPSHRNKGVATMLLSTIIRDLEERGVSAVETFAKKNGSDNPSGPVGLYLKKGFKVKADDPEFPLLRLDIHPFPIKIPQPNTPTGFSNILVTTDPLQGSRILH